MDFKTSTNPSQRELADLLDHSTQAWIQLVNGCADDIFNDMRLEKWSPAQVMMHVILTERGIAKLLETQPTAAPADRTGLLVRIEKGLTDQTRKLTAPQFLEPRREAYDRKKLIEKFKENRDAFNRVLKNATNLDQLFTAFPHPYFGLLTGHEWMYNVLLHADRHYRQFQLMSGITNATQSTP